MAFDTEARASDLLPSQWQQSQFLKDEAKIESAKHLRLIGRTDSLRHRNTLGPIPVHGRSLLPDAARQFAQAVLLALEIRDGHSSDASFSNGHSKDDLGVAVLRLKVLLRVLPNVQRPSRCRFGRLERVSGNVTSRWRNRIGSDSIPVVRDFELRVPNGRSARHIGMCSGLTYCRDLSKHLFCSCGVLAFGAVCRQQELIDPTTSVLQECHDHASKETMKRCGNVSHVV